MEPFRDTDTAVAVFGGTYEEDVTVGGPNVFVFAVEGSAETTIEGTDVAVDLVDSGPGAIADIYNFTITGENATGIRVNSNVDTISLWNTFEGLDTGVETETDVLSVFEGSEFTDNERAVVIREGGAESAAINENTISGNSIGIVNEADETLDATENYWGDDSGPGGDGPGNGDTIVEDSGEIEFAPWLNADGDLVTDGDFAVENFDGEQEAERGETVSASADVTNDLQITPQDRDPGEVPLEYVLTNQDGEEEIVATKTAEITPGETDTVTLEGTIANSTTALAGEELTHEIRIEDEETTRDDENITLSHSIQSALNYAGAEDEDTVAVLDGMYEENVTMDTTGVTLNGAGVDETTIVGNVTVEGDENTIQDLTIEGDYADEGTDNELNNVVVTSSSPGGVVTLAGDSTTLTDVTADRRLVIDGENIAVYNSDIGDVSLDGTVTLKPNAADVAITDSSISSALSAIVIQEGALSDDDSERRSELRDIIEDNTEFNFGESSEVGIRGEDLATQTLVVGADQQLVVDEGSFVDEPSIDGATNFVDAADDSVQVTEGTYEEQVIINNPLTLESEGEVTLLAPTDRASFEIPENDDVREPVIFAYGGDEVDGNISGSDVISVDVKGFTVDGNDVDPGAGDEVSTGILLRNVDGDISNTTVKNMHEGGGETFGITVYGDSVVDITGNHVSGYERGGIGILGDLDEEHPAPEGSVTDNTVSGPGEDVDGWAANGIQIAWGATGEAINNTVTGHLHESAEPGGILATGSEDVLIADNYLEGNVDGVQVFGDAGFYGTDLTSENTTVLNNTIEDHIHGISVGPDAVDTLASANTITENEIGIEVWGDAESIEEFSATHNDIVDNTAGITNYGDYIVNATYNWWGSDTGPSGEGAGTGDSVSENVTFDPWLDAPLDGDPGGVTDDGFSVENFAGADEAERESDSVTASADITNEVEEFGLDDEDGETVTVRYLIDGDEVNSTEVTLVAGETDTVEFEDVSVPGSTTAAAPDEPQATDHKIEVVGAEESASDGADLDLTNPLQQAIDFADTGDIVTALAGTYEEDVTVDVEGLTVEGVTSSEGPTVEPEETGFNVTASNVTIEGMAVDGASEDGIAAEDLDGTLTVVDTVIENVGNDGIAGTAVENVTAIGNVVDTAGGLAGIYVLDGDEALVRNNEISSIDDNGVLLEDLDNAKASDNVVNDLSGNGVQMFAEGSPFEHVTLVDNTMENVTEFSSIFIENAEDAFVSGNTINGSGFDGIGLFTVENATVVDNTVENTTESGVRVDAFDLASQSIQVEDIDTAHRNETGDGDSAVSHNTAAERSTARGESTNRMETSTDSASTDTTLDEVTTTVTFIENDIEHVGEDGIAAFDVGNSTFLDNTVDQTDRYGLNAFVGDESTMNRNSVNGTGIAGLIIEDLDEGVTKNNTVTSTDLSGIYLFVYDTVTVSDNYLNATGDVSIWADGYVEDTAEIMNNDIENSLTRGVEAYGENVTLSENNISSTASSGIISDALEFTATDNVVSGTGGEGIYFFASEEIHVSGNFVEDVESDPDNIYFGFGGIGTDIFEPISGEITENQIQNVSDAGINVGQTSEDGNVTDFSVTQNNIVDNDEGLEADTDDELNATLNWWGSDTGPSGDGPGTGDSVSENVEFDPWLDAPFDEGDVVTDEFNVTVDADASDGNESSEPDEDVFTDDDDLFIDGEVFNDLVEATMEAGREATIQHVLVADGLDGGEEVLDDQTENIVPGESIEVDFESGVPEEANDNDAEHVIRVEETGTEDGLKLTVDNTDPTVEPTTPEEDETVEDPEQQIMFTVDDDVSGVDESTIAVDLGDESETGDNLLDGAGTDDPAVTFDAGEGEVTIDVTETAEGEFEDGSVDVTVSAADNGGNEASDDLIFEVDFSSVENIDRGTTFPTIQAAIDDGETQDGDTLEAEATTFDEQITVDKDDLTIQSESGAGQTTITQIGAPMVEITADGVAFDGFTFDMTGDGVTGIETAGNDVVIENSNFESDDDDLGLNVSSGDAVIDSIEFEGVDDNVGQGVKVGDAMAEITSSEIDASAGEQDSNSYTILLRDGADATITNNDLTPNEEDTGIFLGGADSVTIDGNTMTSDLSATGIGLNSVNGPVEITGNVISGETSSGNSNAGIAISDSGDGVTITENNITDSARGVDVAGFSSVNGDDISINENNIEGNEEYGVHSFTDEPVNATLNWWGDEDGPSGEGDGDGDAVSQNVDFAPWLDDAFPDGEPISPTEITLDDIDENEDISDNSAGATNVEYHFRYTYDLVGLEDATAIHVDFEEEVDQGFEWPGDLSNVDEDDVTITAAGDSVSVDEVEVIGDEDEILVIGIEEPLGSDDVDPGDLVDVVIDDVTNPDDAFFYQAQIRLAENDNIFATSNQSDYDIE